MRAIYLHYHGAEACKLRKNAAGFGGLRKLFGANLKHLSTSSGGTERSDSEANRHGALHVSDNWQFEGARSEGQNVSKVETRLTASERWPSQSSDMMQLNGMTVEEQKSSVAVTSSITVRLEKMEEGCSYAGNGFLTFAELGSGSASSGKTLDLEDVHIYNNDKF